MAKTYTVKKGDNLWNIAETHLGSGAKYTDLAKWNNIPNADLIYPGQVLVLEQPTSKPPTNTSTTVRKNQFGLQADIDNVLFITWDFDRDYVKEYEVQWAYYTTNLVWFGGTGSTTTTKDKYSTYNIPSNAKKVRVKIRPICDKEKAEKAGAPIWNGTWTGWYTHTHTVPPEVPPVPSITLNGLKLTVEVSNLKSDPSMIQFEIVQNNIAVVKNPTNAVITGYCSFKCSIAAGGTYKARCRAKKEGVYSEWSDYSASVNTIPATPAAFKKCEPKTQKSVLLEWTAISNADSYDIEYATDKTHFDTTDKATSKTGITTTSYEVFDIEPEKEYHFRIRAVNAQGTSGWSEISSAIIGKGPSAPTTWSSTSTVTVGEPLTLYWVHNSEDGSTQAFAHLEVYIDNVLTIDERIESSTKENEGNKTNSYSIDTSKYPEGVEIKWRVQTSGLSEVYGEWSTARTVTVYAPAIFTEFVVTNIDDEAFTVLESFPIKVSALAGPNTQKPIGYYISIKSNELYETVDSVGNNKFVNEGEQIYFKHFDISGKLEVEFSAGDLDLENGVSYTLTCTAAMDSGLTAETSFDFEVMWSETSYVPEAEVTIDQETLSANIHPYCARYTSTAYKVSRVAGNYLLTDEVLDFYYGQPTDYVTTTGEMVYQEVDTDSYYAIVYGVEYIEDVLLSVYRREFDGTFTELASGLDGAKNTFITDPYPALDHARYRIVAVSKTTGSVAFYDPPGVPVGGKSVVIQWDETWSNLVQFDTYGEAADYEQPTWTGSMIKLPYNIDISNKHSSDVALVEYAGRKHPVSYYGTQLGESATWNVTIEKSDKDTLYALRRLAIWMGDVYVREPSGSGYWASISVSFSQKHCDLTIPVSIEVVRVEGGTRNG